MSTDLGTLLVKALASEAVEHDDRRQRCDALATRVLDATVQEAAASGLRRLAIEDVAQRAGTTRVTVYRRFGRREHLIEAMAVRETQRFLAAMRQAIEPFDSIEDKGAEAFVAGLRFMNTHPVARRAIASEPEAIVEYLKADDGLLFRLGRDFVAEGLREASPGSAVDEAAETLARIFVSFLLLPDSVVPFDDEDAVRDYVRRCIAPLSRAAPAGRPRR